MAILPENEYTEFENRAYINPQVALDEGNAFIDNLRSTQKTNTDQIKMDTYNLGTAVPSNLGGLMGGSGYFTSRYQTPQTNSLVADLRATNQAKALNDAMENDLARWKKRYNDAKNANAIRNSNPSGGTTPTTNLGVDTNKNGSVTVSKYGGTYEPGKIYSDANGNWHYYNGDDSWTSIGSVKETDTVFGPSANPIGAANPTNGKTMTVNGVDYIYIDSIPNTPGQWYRAGESNGPGE